MGEGVTETNQPKRSCEAWLLICLSTSASSMETVGTRCQTVLSGEASFFGLPACAYRASLRKVKVATSQEGLPFIASFHADSASFSHEGLCAAGAPFRMKKNSVDYTCGGKIPRAKTVSLLMLESLNTKLSSDVWKNRSLSLHFRKHVGETLMWKDALLVIFQGRRLISA